MKKDEMSHMIMNLVAVYREANGFRKKYEDKFGRLDEMDNISGWIADILFVMTMDQNDGDWESTTTYRLLNSDMTSAMVADEMVKMIDRNYGTMPEPKTIEPDEIRKMVEKNGGYCRTKEKVRVNELGDVINCIVSALQVIGEIRGEMDRCKQQIDRIISGESQEDDRK